MVKVNEERMTVENHIHQTNKKPREHFYDVSINFDQLNYTVSSSNIVYFGII